MGHITKSDIVQNITDKLGIQSASDHVANAFSNIVVPVISADEFNQDIVRDSAVSATLFTTPADRDFYLTSVQMTSATASDGSTADTVTFVTPDGATRTITCATADGTLTDSTTNGVAITFAMKGILLKKSSTIVYTKTSGGAAMIVGYIRTKS